MVGLVGEVKGWACKNVGYREWGGVGVTVVVGEG